MTKLLNLDELLECAERLKLPQAAQWKAYLERLGSTMAAHIAGNLGVASGDAHSEGPAFAGTCAAFFPAVKGQPCPSPLDEYDSTEWESDDDENGG